MVDEAKEEILNEKEKLMVFTTGSRTYQAHQIGIKLMSKVKFRTKLNIPENIFEAAEEARRKREEERESRLGRINFEPTPWSDYRQVAQMFDVVDVLIDFHGFVTGYGVSPDSRFFTLPPKFDFQTSQELRMLSSVTLNCQATKIVMNSGSQLSEL